MVKIFLVALSFLAVGCAADNQKQIHKVVYDELSLKEFILTTHGSDKDKSVKALDSLLAEATKDSLVFSQTVAYLNEPFGSPNSAYRNDSLYAVLLEAKMTSPWLDSTRQQLQPLITALETAGSLRRILLLGECLETIARSKQYIQLSNHEIKPPTTRDTAFIEKVFRYTIDNFKENISLCDIAGHSHMSVPAFCHSFKRSTKKTYIHFLNEIRIGYACKLLADTSKPVLDICFASGFNTVANFHKQFLKMKGITPLSYRRSISALH